MKTFSLVLAILLPVSLSGSADVAAGDTAGDSAPRSAVEAARSAGGAGAGSPGAEGMGTPQAAGDRVQPGSGWRWPLAPEPEVLRRFAPPARPWLSGHRGVDLRAARHGADVISPASGTVSFVGTVVDRPVITVDHGHGLKSSFEPVRSSLGPGAAVATGDMLGAVEPGHCAAGTPVAAASAAGDQTGTPVPEDSVPCVHWGVRRGGEYIDPLAQITDLRPSVLLPPLDPWPG